MERSFGKAESSPRRPTHSSSMAAARNLRHSTSRERHATRRPIENPPPEERASSPAELCRPSARIGQSMIWITRRVLGSTRTGRSFTTV